MYCDFSVEVSPILIDVHPKIIKEIK